MEPQSLILNIMLKPTHISPVDLFTMVVKKINIHNE